MGVKSQKKAKTRLDAYYRLAKDQGFRARSAFKLIQLNRKYDFLAKSRVLVDLCAAPGGWCQVAAQHMPVGSKIVGVDLVPIAPIRGVKTFVGDITDDKTRKTIKTWLKKEPVDCVIHDGAPNVGGVWAKDLFAQNALVLSATKMACDLLRPGGWYVTKVFRSTDYQKLIWVFKQLFEKVEATKPLASRMESAEIFVVCHGYKAPRQLDTRLFQASHVFSDVGEEKITLPNGMQVYQKNNVPQGYTPEQFGAVPTRIVTLTDFLDSSDPKTVLTTQHEIRFVSDEEKALLKTRFCKPELVFLMYDLQQVGDADRRRLLRLRDQLIKERARRRYEAETGNQQQQQRKTKKVGEDGAAVEDDVESDQDLASEEELQMDDEAELDDMARQLLAFKRQEEREKKKKQKKAIDRKLKQVRGLINFDPNEASANAPDMFGDDNLGDDNNAADYGNNNQKKKSSKYQNDDDDYDQDAEYDDDYDENEDDEEGDDDEDELSPIQRLGKYTEAELAVALDKYAEDHVDNDRGKHLPNIPLNAINDVHLDPDADMGDADRLRDEDDENHGLGPRLDDGDDDDDFDPNAFLLDEEEDGLLDVDEAGNYIIAKKPTAMVKFQVGGDDNKKESAFKKAKEAAAAASAAAKQSKLDQDAARQQEKKDKKEAKLDEAGQRSKWERRHLNVEQVLRETFAKPKQQRDPKKASRLEEDLVEMGDDPVTARKKKAEEEKLNKKQLKALINKNRLHDESSEDDDDDSDSINSLQSLLSDEDDDGAEVDQQLDEDDDMEDENAAKLARRMLRPGAVTSNNKNKFVPAQGKLTAQEQAKALRKATEKENRKQKKNKNKAKDDFEEIPIAMTDPTVRARTLALATKMLDKKSRQQVLDSSVHRYMIDDDEDLPDWFVEDEQKHYQMNLPVTAHEMEQQRARFMELNSRPSKKVMEAMGRKRKKAQRMLRGMLEKGKTDPLMRNKAAGLSIRKLMRSKTIKGGPGAAAAGKKNDRNDRRGKRQGKYDGRTKGEQKREWDKKKRAKKGGRR